MNRHILLVTPTGRLAALEATIEAIRALFESSIQPVMDSVELDEAKIALKKDLQAVELLSRVGILGETCQLKDVELVLVLGGDGTILKAAETVRGSEIAMLGINHGHVGFLAESEREGLREAVKLAAEKSYVSEERLTLDVSVHFEGKKIFETWALNEATVEKSASGKMIEVVVEVDRRPLSTFGCDGVVISTPTGSTAYAFSAGGPVVWPTVEALLLVPLSAHALFSRPLVVDPKSLLAVEVLTRSSVQAVLWCDGRRTFDLPAGARVEVVKSGQPVRLARLHQGSFTDRLVKKFGLQVTGWRGPDQN